MDSPKEYDQQIEHYVARVKEHLAGVAATELDEMLDELRDLLALRAREGGQELFNPDTLLGAPHTYAQQLLEACGYLTSHIDATRDQKSPRKLFMNQVESRINVQIDGRNRLTVLFRIVLVIPALIFVAAFDQTSSGTMIGVSGLLVFPAVAAIVVRGKYPSYVLSFNRSILELLTRFYAYVLLLTDDYPTIEENPKIRVRFPNVGDGSKLNRFLPLVKWFLAIPLYVVGIFYSIWATLHLFFAWIWIIATGSMPARCAEILTRSIAFWNRVSGYAFVAVTDEYPPFSL
ncbi:MAG: DUF4389 domain-containing protein [Ilumatobacteraceae bacterium]